VGCSRALNGEGEQALVALGLGWRDEPQQRAADQKPD
jgi:hypothetical protein